jgi:hypothetical protein
MKLAVAFSAFILFLAGCATRHQPSEAEVRETAAKNAQRAAAQDKADDSQCKSYGTPPGSDGYTRCRSILAKGRSDDDDLK